MGLSNIEIILRLFTAAVLGGLIGFERERLSWVAGLRTHMLVCLGSALVMIVSKFGFDDILSENLVVLDPSRVAAQVVSGIGFLGAGTILFWKQAIRGLTTAASLWAVAAVGLAVGSGLYLAGILATVFVFLILAGVKPLEKRFFRKRQSRGMRFSIKPGTFSMTSLEDVLAKIHEQYGPTKLQMEISKEEEIFYLIFKTTEKDFLSVMDIIKKLPGVERIEVIDENIN